MSATYRNPWHKRGPHSDSEPTFTANAAPIEYRGFLIYQRIPRSYEVVKDGVCLTQRAELSGAKWAIDNLLNNPSDYWAQRMAGYLAEGANA